MLLASSALKSCQKELIGFYLLSLSKNCAHELLEVLTLFYSLSQKTFSSQTKDKLDGFLLSLLLKSAYSYSFHQIDSSIDVVHPDLEKQKKLIIALSKFPESFPYVINFAVDELLLPDQFLEALSKIEESPYAFNFLERLNRMNKE